MRMQFKAILAVSTIVTVLNSDHFDVILHIYLNFRMLSFGFAGQQILIFNQNFWFYQNTQLNTQNR